MEAQRKDTTLCRKDLEACQSFCILGMAVGDIRFVSSGKGAARARGALIRDTTVVQNEDEGGLPVEMNGVARGPGGESREGCGLVAAASQQGQSKGR